ncbi:MAG: arginase family protein [Dehalococcoidia bacterium]
MGTGSSHDTRAEEHDHATESETFTDATPRSFFGAPLCENLDELSARVALLGVPYDFGTIIPYLRTGSSQGPDAVRDARTYSYFDLKTGEAGGGWFDVEDEAEYLKGVTMADCGNVSIMAGAVQGNLDRITKSVERIAARDALVAAVGGDHSISFPVGRGMERYEEVDVIHFDAHDDFSDEVDGSKFSHGSQLRRLSELPFVRNITMIGLRRCWTKQIYQDALARDVNIVTSRRLMEEGAATAVEKSVRPARYLYVSIDTDVLDVGLVPGTCLPEPEGIPYQLLRQALWEVCKKGQIIGFDLVELSPPHDFGGVSARVTSWLLVHFLSAIAASQE